MRKTAACQAEVLAWWDDQALAVRHLSPGCTYRVGPEPGCDLLVPEGWTPRAFGAASVDHTGQVRVGDVSLPPGAVAWLTIGSVRLRVESQPLEPKPRRFGPDRTVLWLAFAMLVSLGAHAWWLMWALVTVPPSGVADDEASQHELLVLMQHYLSATAQPEREAADVQLVNEVRLEEGGTGFRESREEGAAGISASRAVNRHYAVRGYADDPDPHIARTEARHEAAEFGLIGLLNQRTGGDPGAPVAPWGHEQSAGTDMFSARGLLWGDTLGASHGAGGLGLTGIGEGGGGRGEGVGLGTIGTIGHGAGTGTSHGFGKGSHRAGPVMCGCGASLVNGRLPPETIKRVVLANHGRFRFCYAQGLKANPSLQGRVTTRFVIGRDGSVSLVGNAGSDLPDQQVVQCVQRSFYGLSFPEPEGGIVTVVYPLVFTPSVS